MHVHLTCKNKKWYTLEYQTKLFVASETCFFGCDCQHKLLIRILQPSNIQSEHKVFPSLQTFIAKQLRGIQTYIFFKNYLG
jgi:hypothetical protein